MAQRQAKSRAAKAAQDDYIRSVARPSVACGQSGGQGLLDAGTISQEEFESLKAKALA